MAEIKSRPLINHLRSEPTMHTLQYRKGELRRTGPGLAFWFRPLVSAVAEVPLDDRDLPFIFDGRSSDFQEVKVEGTVTYRVTDPATVATRVDFSLDLESGDWLQDPLDQLSGLITQLAQQFVQDYLMSTTLSEILEKGIAEIRAQIAAGLANETALKDLGIDVVAIRVAAVHPTHEMEKLLQRPVNEAIQNQADQATYARRAEAVEQESAISEAEQASQLEKARRDALLIAQQGNNQRKRIDEEAAAAKLQVTATEERSKIQVESQTQRSQIEAEAQAERTKTTTKAQAEAQRVTSEATADAEKVMAAAEASRVEQVEGAKVEAERQRVELHKQADPRVLMAEALREFAQHFPGVENLTITPDLLTNALERFNNGGK